MSDVVVVGSLSMDFTARAERLPLVGETLIGSGFVSVPGGKGNNQALACALQGVATSMVGCIGTDQLGAAIVDVFTEHGLDASHLIRDPSMATGIAHITVDEEGRNAIVIVPRANSTMSAERVRERAALIRGARVVLTQLEIPVAATHAALEIGREAGAVTILNPAPAAEVEDELLRLADICVPNEIEAWGLTGRQVTDHASAEAAASALRDRGCREVVVTLGGRGALYVGPEGTLDVPAFEVDVVDTVAAGDAFCGALAAALARGAGRAEALRRASAAGALATTLPGASTSLPSAGAVEIMLSRSSA